MDKNTILKEHREAINSIMENVTTPKDKKLYSKVAGLLSRSINISQKKAGNIKIPEDTKLYKMAMVIENSKSKNQFTRNLKEQFGSKRQRILNELAYIPWVEPSHNHNKQDINCPDIEKDLQKIKRMVNAMLNLVKKTQIAA